MENSYSMNSQEVKFIAKGVKKIGFKGWKRYASFTDYAKNLLLKEGPDAFRGAYGDFFIQGKNMGASCTVEITSKTKTTQTESSVSTSLESSWSGYGVEAGVNASFS